MSSDKIKERLAKFEAIIAAENKGCRVKTFTVSRGFGMYSLPTKRWCRKQGKWLDNKNLCEECLKIDNGEPINE